MTWPAALAAWIAFSPSAQVRAQSGPPASYEQARANFVNALPSGLKAFREMEAANATGTLLNPEVYHHYDSLNAAQVAAKLTGDPGWSPAIKAAKTQWRDLYVLPQGGLLPGHRQFTGGLVEDWRTNGETDTRDAILMLAAGSYTQAPFSPGWRLWTQSRPVALATLAMLDGQAVDRPLPANYGAFIDAMLAHVDQWFRPSECPATIAPNWSPELVAVQPFMVGITLKALIAEYERSKDPRIPPYIKMALDGLWSLRINDGGRLALPYWDRDTAPLQDRPDLPAAYKGYYDGRQQPKPSPVLNSYYTAPFAWYAATFADPEMTRRHDLLFMGHPLAHGRSVTAKEFNQALWSEKDRERWRQAAPIPLSTGIVATITSGEARPATIVVQLDPIGSTPAYPVIVSTSDAGKGGVFRPTRAVLSPEHRTVTFSYAPPKAAPDAAYTLVFGTSGTAGMQTQRVTVPAKAATMGAP